MWWRVELDRDGGIKTVTEVEATNKGSRFVCYVQATDKAAACEAAKMWDTRRRRAINDCRRKHNQCVHCGSPRVEGKRLCGFHLALTKAKTEPERRRLRSEHRRPDARARHERFSARLALTKFDELGPAKFRLWLVGIVESTEIRAAVPEAAE